MTTCQSTRGRDGRKVGGESSPRAAAAAADPASSPTAATVECGAEEEVPMSKWEAIRSNPNVFRVLIFCLIDGGAYSIWSMHVFQVLIKDLGGDKHVGFMSMASGIAQMVAAMLAGFVGEQFLRQSVLRLGAIFGIIAVLITLFGLAGMRLTVFYFSQFFWGAYGGVVATGTEAIFADSVATGRRAFVYNVKWIDQTMSSVVGTVIALIILVSMGDTWDRNSVVNTMIGGLLVHPLAMATLFTLRDKYSLHEDEDEANMARQQEYLALAEMADDSDNVKHGHHHSHEGDDRDKNNRSSSSAEGGECSTTAAAAAAAARRGTWRQMQPSSSRQCLRPGAPSGGLQSPAANEDRRVCDEDAAEDVCVPDAPAQGAPEASDVATVFVNTESAAAAAAAAEEETASVAGVSTTGLDGALPTGCGEHAVMRYLENQHRRENEAYRSEQAALQGQPVQALLCAVRYYSHVMFTWEAVPYFVCLVDFLVAFGSGMTMRFLSLYFIKDKNTAPSVLMTANLIICPVQAILSHCVQVGGTRYIGRITSTIVVRTIGTVLMLFMGLFDIPLPLLLPVFILRNALMNSTRGITRSVIMDAVKKENRAKWSAFESFSSFTWAGSAAIGGLIAEAHGYQFSFTVTALFHFCALAVLIPAAIGAAPVENEIMREERERAAARKARRCDTDGAAMRAEEVVVESG